MFESVPHATWDYCIRVVRPALLLAPDYLQQCRARLAADGIQAAVARRDTAAMFDWCARLLARQGISNGAAEVYIERHGSPTWDRLSAGMATSAFCPRLRSFWDFEGCGFRRVPRSCHTAHHLIECPVAAVPARKGSLAVAATGLWLFLRDVAEGDFAGWIDKRLAEAANGPVDDRATRMRTAVLEPLAAIPGTGLKTWSMILAELLLGADPKRTRWIEVGASFVAVDTLVHAFMRRTGILHRLEAEHSYGPSCYERGGCASIIEQLALRIDARKFSAENPACFPRGLQFSIWWFCAADGWAICQGNSIDDRDSCRQRFCPSFGFCERLPLRTAERLKD